MKTAEQLAEAFLEDLIFNLWGSICDSDAVMFARIVHELTNRYVPNYVRLIESGEETQQSIMDTRLPQALRQVIMQGVEQLSL